MHVHSYEHSVSFFKLCLTYSSFLIDFPFSDPQPPDVTHTAQSRRYTTGADRVNRYNQVSRQTSDDGMSKFLNKLKTHCKFWMVLFYFCIFGECFA